MKVPEDHVFVCGITGREIVARDVFSIRLWDGEAFILHKEKRSNDSVIIGEISFHESGGFFDRNHERFSEMLTKAFVTVTLQ